MVPLLRGVSSPSSPSSSSSKSTSSPTRSSPRPTNSFTPPVLHTEPIPTNANTPQTQKIFNFVSQMQKSSTATSPPPGFPTTPQYSDLDQGGDVQYEDSGNLLYFTSSGFSYCGGHGRNKCSKDDCLAFARDRGYVPNNCGMHNQWALPPGFQFCSSFCRGGYCQCLLRY